MRYLKYLFLGLVLTFSLNLNAQSERAAVKRVVLDLFDAMRSSDTILLKSCFYSRDIPLFTSYKNEEGNYELKKGSLTDFITSVGTPHDEVYDERLGAYSIHIDDGLASMTIDYYFFVGNTFSHCGVDFFEFYKTDEGWKIIFLSDTRRKICDVPDKTW